MSLNDDINRIIWPLHLAINVALNTIKLREQNIECNIPYIVGSPGGGKTKIIEKMVKDRGWGFLSYTPGLERVEKFGGIPDFIKVKGLNLNDSNIEELGTIWSIPQMIVDARKLSMELDVDGKKKYNHIIIMLDDWHLCPANIQQIGFELFTHFSLNNHNLPKNTFFILAGNEKSSAGAKIQLSAIRNRCTMYFTESDVDYWINNFAIPNNILDIGLSYFSYPEKKIYFHQEESTISQFGSPRSWTSAFNQLKYYLDNKINISNEYLKAIIQGNVGSDAAHDFWIFYKIYSEINAVKIFDTNVWEIPKDSIQQFAFGSAISMEFYNRYNKTYYNKQIKKTDKDDILKSLHIQFSKILNDLFISCQEIAVLSIKQIYNKKENEKNKLRDGAIILAEMSTIDEFNKSIFVKLREMMITLKKELIS